MLRSATLSGVRDAESRSSDAATPLENATRRWRGCWQPGPKMQTLIAGVRVPDSAWPARDRVGDIRAVSRVTPCKTRGLRVRALRTHVGRRVEGVGGQI